MNIFVWPFIIYQFRFLSKVAGFCILINFSVEMNYMYTYSFDQKRSILNWDINVKISMRHLSCKKIIQK